MVFCGQVCLSLLMFGHVWSCMVHMVMYDLGLVMYRHRHIQCMVKYVFFWSCMALYDFVRKRSLVRVAILKFSEPDVTRPPAPLKNPSKVVEPPTWGSQ